MTQKNILLKFAVIIIGDEILSGKRQDKHLNHVIETFKDKGLSIHHVQYVGDTLTAIQQAILFATEHYDSVITFGGIGSTPDDHTRQAVGYAFQLPLVLHSIAQACITERCIERGEPDMTTPANQARLQMGYFPEGAMIVPNAYNNIPAFSLNIQGKHNKQLYCLPGFPVMAWPMLSWILDTDYSHLFHQIQELSKGFLVFNVLESSLTPLMQSTEFQFLSCGLKVYSLPCIGNSMIESGQPHIELGCKIMASSNVSETLLITLNNAVDLLKSNVLKLGGVIKAL